MNRRNLPFSCQPIANIGGGNTRTENRILQCRRRYGVGYEFFPQNLMLRFALKP